MHSQELKAKSAFENGMFFLKSGNLKEAETCFKKSLAYNPNSLSCLNSLGITSARLGKFHDAIKYFQKMISLKPDSWSSYYNLGNQSRMIGGLEDAEKYYKTAIAYKADFFEAMNNLGEVLVDLGRVEEGIEYCERALSIHADSPIVLSNLGYFYEKTNKLEKAEKYTLRALEVDPENAHASLTLANLLRRKGQVKNAIKILEKFSEVPITPQETAVGIYFELGKLYDREQATEKAFKNFSRGNELKHRNHAQIPIEQSLFLREVKKCGDTLTADWIGSWQPAAKESDKNVPTFLVGFPRSGTTLLDQILDSHPKIQVLEEKEPIRDVIAAMATMNRAYPAAVADVHSEEVEKLRGVYFESVSKHLALSGDKLTVDKFPLNICHIPLIVRLFPTAKVVLAMRHPCDVILSNFMQNYSLNAAMASFLTVKDSTLAYEQVMGLWLKYVDHFQVNFQIVKYESLLSDLKGESGKLLDFLNVGWDNKVLEFHQHAKTRGLINTPSYQSVTEPIYHHSAYRWKRYEAYLEPYMEKLNPFIAEFGY